MKPKTKQTQEVQQRDTESDFAAEEEVENEESVGGKECGMCHDVPESIIYLSCEHIVCLVCAAKLILSGIGENQPINLSEVVCGICQETTVLSVEVQETLIEFLNQQEFDDEEEAGDDDAAENKSQHSGPSKEESEENSMKIKSERSVKNKEKVTEPKEMKDSMRREKEGRGGKTEAVQPASRFGDRLRNEEGSSGYDRETSKAKDPKRANAAADTKTNVNKGKASPVIKGASREKSDIAAQSKNADISQQKSLTQTSERSRTDQKRKLVSNQRTDNDTDEAEEEIAEETENQADQNQEEEPSDFLTTFYCVKHVDEEYTYYNPTKKALFCAQCLISEIDSKEELSLVRPLKKCLPEILQNFQDMLNDIEVQKSLLENKRKDFEIRKEGAKVQAVSMAKKLELAFDEILDYVQEVKMSSLKALEMRNRALLNDLEGKENAIEERANFFNGVLEEVTNLRQNSQAPEEELFVFFFANQDKISKALVNESSQSADSEMMKVNRVFDDFMAKTKQEQARQCRLGQEAIRDKLIKNIGALGGVSVSELSEAAPAPQSKLAALLTAELGKDMLNKTINQPTSKNTGSLMAIPESENNNKFVNQPVPQQPQSQLNTLSLTAQQAQQSKRLNTNSGTDTYTQFVEKVRNLPSRTNNSVDVQRYTSQVRALSRGGQATPPPTSEQTLFSRDYTSSNYFKTVTKNNYNLEKKLELEQKLKFFDLKSRKDDANQSGFGGLGGINSRVNPLPFSSATATQKAKTDLLCDKRSLQNTSYNTTFRTTGWVFGK